MILLLFTIIYFNNDNNEGVTLITKKRPLLINILPAYIMYYNIIFIYIILYNVPTDNFFSAQTPSLSILVISCKYHAFITLL